VETTKVTFNLPTEVLAALKQLAAERQTTVTSVLRSAISTEVFLSEKVRSGAKILVEGPDHKLQRVLYR
jgi:predicted transcriptional regulator